MHTEAPYDIDGRAPYPAAADRISFWHGSRRTVNNAHVYDLKTGAAGIEPDWEFRVERYACGLFKPEELRPNPPSVCSGRTMRTPL